MENEKLVYGKGAIIWFALCIVANVFGLLINLISGFVLMLIVSLVVMAGYIWLLIGKKRIAFYMILAAVSVTMVLNIVVYELNILSSAFGLLNPLITYIILRKYWVRMS